MLETKKRGFTLVELIIVIGIIGILFTITLFSARHARTKARETQIKVDIRDLTSALITYASLNQNKYPQSNGGSRCYEFLKLNDNLKIGDQIPNNVDGKTDNSPTTQALLNSGVISKMTVSPLYDNVNKYYRYCSNGKDNFQIYAPMITKAGYIYEGTAKDGVRELKPNPPKITDFHAVVTDNVTKATHVYSDGEAVQNFNPKSQTMKLSWTTAKDTAVFCQAKNDWVRNPDSDFTKWPYDSPDFKNLDNEDGESITDIFDTQGLTDYKFTLSCPGLTDNLSSDAAYAEKTITVNASSTVPAGPSVTLYANNVSDRNVSVPANQDYTLSWVSHHSNSCTATSTEDSRWTGSLPLESNPFISLSPLAAGTYSYTMICSNKAGDKSPPSSVTVTVEDTTYSPKVHLYASPDATDDFKPTELEITKGDFATLKWDATDVYSCTPSWESKTYNAASEGSLDGTLSSRTYLINRLFNDASYHIDCAGMDENPISADIHITVVDRPKVTLKVNDVAPRKLPDGSIEIFGAFTGDNRQLSWDIQNAVSPCQASGDWSGNKSFVLDADGIGHGNDGVTLSLVKLYTFNLTCSNADGISNTATVKINVEVAKTPVAHLSANHSEIEVGSDVMLTWSSEESLECTASSSPDIWSGKWIGDNPGGSQSLTLSEANTYSFTVICQGYGDAGKSDPALVSVKTIITPTVGLYFSGLEPPVKQINRFTGDTVNLDWTSTNAESCDATGDWAGSKPTSSIDSGHFTTPALNAVKTYTYTLTCTSSTNTISEPSTVIVTIDQSDLLPSVDIQADGSQGPVTLGTGGFTTLSWTAHNVDACTTAWDNSKTDADISTGTLSGSSLMGPLSKGTYTYTINCVGFSGQTASDSVEVDVENRPTVYLYANGQNHLHDSPSSNDPVVFTERDDVVLNWSIPLTDIKSCTASGNWSGNKSFTSAYYDPGYPPDNFGSEDFGLLNVGNYSYTLTCYDNNGLSGSDHVDLKIVESSQPWVDIKASTPDVSLSDGPVSVVEGDPVTLSWTSRNINPPLMAEWNLTEAEAAQYGRNVSTPSGSETIRPSLTDSTSYDIRDQDWVTDNVIVNVVSPCSSISNFNLDVHSTYFTAKWKSLTPAHGYFYYKRSDLPDLPSNWTVVEFGSTNALTPDYNPQVTGSGLDPDVDYDYYVSETSCHHGTFHTPTADQECINNYYGLNITNSPDDATTSSPAFEWKVNNAWNSSTAQPNTIAGKVEPGTFGPGGNKSCPAADYPLANATVAYHVIDNIGGSLVQTVYGETVVPLDANNRGAFHLSNIDKTLFGSGTTDEIYIKQVTTRSGTVIDYGKYQGNRTVADNLISNNDYGHTHVYSSGEVGFTAGIGQMELYPDGERIKFPGSFHVNFNETFYVGDTFSSLNYDPGGTCPTCEQSTAPHYTGAGPAAVTAYPPAQNNPFDIMYNYSFYIDAKSDGTGYYNGNHFSSFDLATTLYLYSPWDGHKPCWDPDSKTVSGACYTTTPQCNYESDAWCSTGSSDYTRRYFDLGGTEYNCFFRDNTRGSLVPNDVGSGGSDFPSYYRRNNLPSVCTDPTL